MITEEDIVIKCCELMDVNYSHYDNHKMGLDYFTPIDITSIPKIVVYTQKYGHWAFSILEDMTIVTPYTSSLSLQKKLREMLHHHAFT